MNLFDAVIPSIRVTEKVFISSYEYHGVRLHDNSWNLSISSINVDRKSFGDNFWLTIEPVDLSGPIFRTLSMIKLT